MSDTARRAWRVSLAVGLTLLALALGVDHWYGKRIRANERARVHDRMLPYANALHRTIDRRVGVLAGLYAFVLTRSTRAELEDEFALFARGAVAAAGIRAMQYVDDGKIVRIEPVEENGDALGVDAKRDPRPEIRADHARAMASTGPSLFGPIPLREGGIGILLRRRLPDRPGFPQIVALVLDAASITRDAGIPDSSSGLRLELRRNDERWMYSDVLDAASDPVTLPLQVEGENWTLRGAPREGWDLAVRRWRMSVRLTLAAIVLFGVLLALVIAGREDRLAREMEDSGSALSVAMRAGGTGVWSIDVATQRVEAIGAPSDALGGAGARIVVPFSTVLATIGPAHRDQVSRYEAEMSRGERESFSTEFPVIGPAGATRWQLATCQLVRDENGGPQAIVGAIADVTQQRLLAEQLRQAQRLEAVGKLAGGVAHDFNNLLVAVSGFAEFALSHTRAVEGEAAREIARLLTSVVTGAQDGARLTRQLLTFSRRGVVPPSKVDLSAVIGEMRPLLARLFQGRLEVGLDLAYALPPVRGEQALVTQFVLGILMQVRERAGSATRASLRTFVVHASGERPHDAPLGEWVALEVAAAGIRSLARVSFAGVDEASDAGTDDLPAGELGLTVLASGFEAIGGRLVASTGDDGLVVRAYLAPWSG